MKKALLTVLVAAILCPMLRAADDDSYKIHVYNWSYGRERKTITSSNRVTGNFMIKNVSTENLADLNITLSYTAGVGEQAAKPLTKHIGALKAGESQKVAIVGDFIPVFTGYTMTVEYAPKKKEEWFSPSDVGQPEPKNGEPLKGTASIVLLGKEVAPDKTGKFGGNVRVQNEGTVEANNVKITITFFDTKKQKMGEWSGKLGSGRLAGGAEATIPFNCPNAPRNYGGYEIKVGCDDTSAEVALSGGDFTNAEEVECAKYEFKRADPKSPDLHVTAKVRNGVKSSVDNVKITLFFFNAKKKELKRFTYEVPGEMKAGEIKPIQFTIAGVPPYDAFEQKVDYKKPDGPVAAKSNDTKIQGAKFQNIPDVEVIFVESVTNDDKSVSFVGAVRNGKNNPVKDIVISTAIVKDGNTFNVDKTLSDVLKPGEEHNFVVKAPNAAGFNSYSFKFKYVEVAAKGAETSAAKLTPEEKTN